MNAQRKRRPLRMMARTLGLAMAIAAAAGAAATSGRWRTMRLGRNAEVAICPIRRNSSRRFPGTRS
jgi:hypothetical protein